MFHKSGCTLDEAWAALVESGLRVQRQPRQLEVQCHQGPILRVYFATGSDVQTEANEIGEGNPFGDKLKLCDSRFEISFDDLDKVLDEINTLIEVQLTLQNATQGIMWNS